MTWRNSLTIARRLLSAKKPFFDVAGKVALITGGSDGIGWEAARQLHAQGASVVIINRKAEAGQKAVAALGGERALAIAADVSDRAAMQAAIAQTVAHFGRLDVVVANAGITPPPATLLTCKLEDFDRVISVNLFGVLNTVHPALPELIKRQGHIVVVGSAAAFCPPVGGAAYMVSKAAVEQLGRGLKLELAQHGVSVTVSYFGLVDTQLARATLDDDPVGATLEERLPAPLRKRISAQEAGEVLLQAIQQRAETSMAPMAWQPYSRLRGLINPAMDRVLMADPSLSQLLRDLECRNGA